MGLAGTLASLRSVLRLVWSNPSAQFRLLIPFVVRDMGVQTPAFVYDEIENYEELIVEKSGTESDRVAQFVDLLFQYIEIVPADDLHPAIEAADEAIGDTDPDDVLYLACALASDAAIWSDDSDFDEQNLVARYSTSDVIDTLDTR